MEKPLDPTQAQLALALFKGDLLTRDEARALLGYLPLDTPMSAGDHRLTRYRGSNPDPLAVDYMGN